MGEEYPHFKIHVAKAKDLPLSWFELILCPDKFRKHLETLCKNPNAEPTAFQLIGTFLEQAKCLPGQSVKVGSEGAMQEERRVALINSALLLASLLHWDLALLEKRLSTVVQYGLVSQLYNTYILNGTLPSKNSDSLMAHVIHSQWVLRFVFRHKNLPSLPARSGTPAPETNSSSLEQIDSTTRALISSALEFLNGLLSTNNSSVPDSISLPKVGVALSTTGGTVEHLEPPDSGGQDEWSRPKEQVLCEISYTLGCYYFSQSDLSRACELFTQCQDYLSALSSPTALLVNQADLRGFLSACGGVRGEPGVGISEVAAKLEEIQLSKWQGIADVLVKDFVVKELPLGSRLCLERRGAMADSNKSLQEPPAKRLKTESDQSGDVLLEEGLCAYNGLREVMENKAPLPRFWQLVQGREGFVDHVLDLCGKLLLLGISSEEQFRLQSFARMLCVSDSKGGRGYERLSRSSAKELVSPRDDSAHKRMVSLTTVPKLVAKETSSSLQTLESGMCQEVTAEATLSAVERLFKTTPTNQHRAVALRWVGVSPGFVPVESIGDPLTFTKYNILVHRGKTLRQAKSYASSVEMFSCALKLLSPKTTPLSSAIRQGLEEWLREEILTLELLHAHSTLTPDNVERRLQSGELAPLIAKSKAYCLDGRHKFSEGITSHLTSALLLNTQNYSFLFSRGTQLEPGVIAPRLANCVHCVKEGRELRKPIRDLFDAVLTVFCPPLNTGEGKVETSEKQSKLRAGLDIFVENLMDTISLSLLVAALARVWNLLEKPEFEILSEYRNHWPTAIGTPGSVDSNQVHRSLSTTIARSLRLEPDNTAWIVIQGHIFCAKQNYGAALHSYLSAGSLVSSYFQIDVPQDVWTPDVYKRLIACCSTLGYHTHALVLCQLLDPVDYEHTFSMMKNNVGALSESLFSHLWDMAIIEYLIYILSSKGEKHKQKIAIQVAGQPELNFNNSSDVLTKAVHIRKRKFLRTLFNVIN